MAGYRFSSGDENVYEFSLGQRSEISGLNCKDSLCCVRLTPGEQEKEDLGGGSVPRGGGGRAREDMLKVRHWVGFFHVGAAGPQEVCVTELLMDCCLC